MSQSSACVYPCLHYQDAPAAIDWLERAFGFRKLMAIPNPDGSIAHAEVQLDGAVVMVGSAKPERGWLSPRDLPGLNQTVYLVVADVDAHYQTARAAGAEIVDELVDHDYGRMYTARDLEGHVWSFGNYRPELP